MDEKEFLKNVQEALQTTKELSLDTSLLDLNEWDSLGMVSIIAMADEKYGKKIAFGKLMDLDIVSDLFEIVQK